MGELLGLSITLPNLGPSEFLKWKYIKAKNSFKYNNNKWKKK